VCLYNACIMYLSFYCLSMLLSVCLLCTFLLLSICQNIDMCMSMFLSFVTFLYLLACLFVRVYIQAYIQVTVKERSTFKTVMVCRLSRNVTCMCVLIYASIYTGHSEGALHVQDRDAGLGL
jgi:hypothetical protein